MLVLVLLWHFKGRFKDIDAVKWSTDQHFEVDRVVAYFLDFLLSLVQEHQFIGYFRVFLLIFHCHVPNGQPIILASHCDNGFLIRLKTDWCDRFCVPVETKQFVVGFLIDHPQVPHLDFAVIRSSHDKMCGYFIPIADIHIPIMSLYL